MFLLVIFQLVWVFISTYSSIFENRTTWFVRVLHYWSIEKLNVTISFRFWSAWPFRRKRFFIFKCL